MEVSGLFSVDGYLCLNKTEVKSPLLDPGQNKNQSMYSSDCEVDGQIGGKIVNLNKSEGCHKRHSLSVYLYKYRLLIGSLF
jgi:hypothetical protein